MDQWNIAAREEVVYSFNDGNGWSPPVNISNYYDQSSYYQDIALDENDQPHVVWKQLLPYIQGEVFYSFFDGISWSDPVNITNTGGKCYYPKIAVSLNSKFICFLYEHSSGVGDSYLLYSYCQNNTWSVPDTILPTNMGGNAALDFDCNDNLQIIISPIITLGNTDVLHLTYVNNSSLLPTILTPANPPITIPSSGGSFTYDVEIGNQAVLPVTFDAWIDAILPNGSVYGPVILRQVASLPSGNSIMRADLNQSVPPGAPAGNYYYRLQVGSWIDSVVVSADSFALVKESPIEIENGDWILKGWENDDESSLEECGEIPSRDKRPALQKDLNFVYAYPNPFNPSTALSFKLSVSSRINLSVYDIAGKKVAELVDGWLEAGTHEVAFDPIGAGGSGLASGVYIYRLEALSGSGSEGGLCSATTTTEVGKMILMK